MIPTVRDIYDLIDRIAPFETAEEWDNVGLLAGRYDACAERAMCALELNTAVLREAIDRRAQLIITHHPILFSGRKNLREDDAEGRMLCELVRNHISLIAAHTNYDIAAGGVNDALASALKLADVEAPEQDMLRIGAPEQCTLGEFADFAQRVLGAPIRRYGEADRRIHRVALLGGSGGSYAQMARRYGADVFLTGEIGHHAAWSAYEDGMCVLEAGHGATELPAISTLAEGLQKAANALQYKIDIQLSETELFR